MTNLQNYQKIAKLDFERYFKEEKHEITKSANNFKIIRPRFSEKKITLSTILPQHSFPKESIRERTTASNIVTSMTSSALSQLRSTSVFVRAVNRHFFTLSRSVNPCVTIRECTVPDRYWPRIDRRYSWS